MKDLENYKKTLKDFFKQKGNNKFCDYFESDELPNVFQFTTEEVYNENEQDFLDAIQDIASDYEFENWVFQNGNSAYFKNTKKSIKNFEKEFEDVLKDDADFYNRYM